jgi:hypothetical protein
MTDETEPTPPPERPLPEPSRVRIRAELLAHAHDHRSTGPRWAVPLGAAAAVALVAGMGVWAVRAGGDGPEATPAAGGASSAPATPSATPSDEGTSTPTAPSSGTQVGTGTCEQELAHVLDGAALALEFPADPDGQTSIWVKGDRFALCDVRDGTTTVHHPLPITPRGGVDAYAVSSVHEGTQVTRVAGGARPPGVEGFDVVYTFPDGRVQQAEHGRDAEGRWWWRVVHTARDPGGSELDQPPIQVAVRDAGGTRETYTLAWGVDTCAQANHGC